MILTYLECASLMTMMNYFKAGYDHTKTASFVSLDVSKYYSAIYMKAAKFMFFFFYTQAIHYDHCVNTISNQLL